MRMKSKIYIMWCLALLTLASCSTQKNTWASRSFHQMKTKYNIHYNGQIAFDEGLEAISEAHEDDYSAILPLYPVSNHEAAQAAASQMDRTIEKCRKCIKLHSIKTKPKKINHQKRRNDPKYKAWLEQEEFNNQMGNAWRKPSSTKAISWVVLAPSTISHAIMPMTRIWLLSANFGLHAPMPRWDGSTRRKMCYPRCRRKTCRATTHLYMRLCRRIFS